MKHSFMRAVRQAPCIVKEAGDDSWQQLSADASDPSENGLVSRAQARVIAIHPQNPDLVYVGTQREVYRSKDRGDNWENLHFEQFTPIMYSRGV